MINFTRDLPESLHHLCTIFTWANMPSAEDGQMVELANWADRSAQVFGTFGSGSVVIEGSNDGANWATLSDHVGSALSFSSPGIKMVAEMTRYIRPRVSGGTGGTALTVCLIVRSAK